MQVAVGRGDTSSLMGWLNLVKSAAARSLTLLIAAAAPPAAHVMGKAISCPSAPPDAVVACRPLILQLGIFKSGSTALCGFVRSVCGVGDDRLRQQALQAQDRDGSSLCIALLRSPVSRFLAQYAEISEIEGGCNSTRRATHRRLAVTPSQRHAFDLRRIACHRAHKVAELTGWSGELSVEGRLLRLVETMRQMGSVSVASRLINKHLATQASLLQAATAPWLHQNRTPSPNPCAGRVDFAGATEDATSFFAAITRRLGMSAGLVPGAGAGAGAVTGPGKARTSTAEHRRSEMDPSYLRRNWMDTDSLSRPGRRAIELAVCELYLEDYCRLRLQPPASCEERQPLARRCASRGLDPWRSGAEQASGLPSWTRWAVPPPTSEKPEPIPPELLRKYMAQSETLGRTFPAPSPKSKKVQVHKV